jgi:hypothetical protein
MEERYAIASTSSLLTVAEDRPVVFHGVNKSGSLAMANVLREAYYDQGRANQFFCSYLGIPKWQADFNRILTSSTGHSLFISHYIYRDVPLPPDAILVTQLRHPLPRTLSVYGWLKRNHLNRHDNKLDGFPSLEAWIRSMKGRGHTQMAQFAHKLGVTREDTVGLTNDELYELAVENFERDVVWFGVAELFEESAFALGHICGLESIAPWSKDTRNRWRQSLSETDEAIIELIQETYAHEFRFYERALETFRARIEEIDFGPSLDAYKARCNAEYGERLVS